LELPQAVPRVDVQARPHRRLAPPALVDVAPVDQPATDTDEQVSETPEYDAVGLKGPVFETPSGACGMYNVDFP
jgi:hypothetical protein